MEPHQNTCNGFSVKIWYGEGVLWEMFNAWFVELFVLSGTARHAWYFLDNNKTNGK